MSRSSHNDRILRFISEEDASGRLPPTQREIANALYLSRSTVQRCLTDLENMGCIATIPGKARSLTIIRKPNRFHNIYKSERRSSE